MYEWQQVLQQQPLRPLDLPTGRKRGSYLADLGLNVEQRPDKRPRYDGQINEEDDMEEDARSSSGSRMETLADEQQEQKNKAKESTASALGLQTSEECSQFIKNLYVDFEKARVPQRRCITTPNARKLRVIDAPVPGAWKPVTQELIDFHQRNFDIKRRNRQILLREEVAAERMGSNDVEFSTGWLRYLRLQQCLNSMGVIRSARQRKIHETFIMATIHHLWGTEWESCKVQVMRKLKMTKRKEQAMCVAPRREGKSWLMMMLCLAFGLTVPGITQALMAPSKRACKADMAILLNFLAKIPGGPSRLVAHSEELLTLSAADVANEEVQMAKKMGGNRFKTTRKDAQMSGNQSTVQIFPSNERTSRGYTAKITYMEEAAFMNASYFDKVILHQAVGVEGNSLLAISSPDDEYNYYSELVDLKDAHGEPLFYVVILGMACQECINKGIAEKCIHKLDELAAWKSVERYMMVSQVLSRKKDIMMREQQGLMVGKRQPYFDALYIRMLFDRPVYTFQNAPHVLHMSMDPSGGGTLSNYTISTLGFENGMTVVSTLCIRSNQYKLTPCPHHKVDYVECSPLVCRPAALVAHNEVGKQLARESRPVVDALRLSAVLSSVYQHVVAELDVALKVDQEVPQCQVD